MQKPGEGGLIVNHQSANDSSGSVLSVSLWQIPPSRRSVSPLITRHSPLSPAVARNPAKSPAPTADASGFADASSPSESVLSNAGTPLQNACTPAPARETPHPPDTAERPTMRNTPDRPRTTAGRAPRIFPERTPPVPANSPSRTRSYLFPDRCPYKSGTPAGARREAQAATAPSCGPAKNASSPQAPEYPSAAAPSLHQRFLHSAQTSVPAQTPAHAEIPGKSPDT